MNLESDPDVFDLGANQRILVIAGWNYGFQKVEFTKMLRTELGYSLAEAKRISDVVLTGTSVELVVPTSGYEQISLSARKLGACVIDQAQPDSEGKSCR